MGGVFDERTEVDAEFHFYGRKKREQKNKRICGQFLLML